MAKVKIQGNASGTGVLTVTAPNTSTDRTITLPDATGAILTADGDGSSLTGIQSPLVEGTDYLAPDGDGSSLTGIQSPLVEGTDYLAPDGDGSNLTGISGGTITALNSATENELVTVGATTTELDAEANLTFDGTDLTIGTGNIVIATAGKGIDFSATSDGIVGGTQVDTSEVLDDYEEGVWFPKISDEYSNDATMHVSFNEMSYTKIGRVVHVSGVVGTTSLGSLSGTMYISNLPYAVTGGFPGYGSVSVSWGNWLAISAGQNVGCQPISGTNMLRIRLWDSSVGSSDMTTGEWSADGAIAIGGCYITYT